MKTLRTTLLACAAFLFVTPTAHAVPFEDLNNKAYVVVITGSESDPMYGDEIAALTADADNYKSHSIITIRFQDRYLETLPNLSSFAYTPQFLRNKSAALAGYYEQFLQTSNNAFSVVVVGKDGTVHQVWTKVAQPDEIYAALDAPPLNPPVVATPGAAPATGDASATPPEKKPDTRMHNTKIP